MQEEWDMLAAKFSRMTDGAERPIDHGILETVIAFNALHIHTVMSCEGHIDDGRGLIFPWVDIEDPGVQGIKKEIDSLQSEVAPLEQEIDLLYKAKADLSLIDAFYGQLDKKYQPIKKLRLQARILQCESRNKLIHYLHIFYEKHRDTPFDRRLIITTKTSLGRTRLGTQGMEDFYLAAPYEIQKQKLEEAQEEMQAFTRFLREIYFSKQYFTIVA